METDNQESADRLPCEPPATSIGNTFCQNGNEMSCQQESVIFFVSFFISFFQLCRPHFQPRNAEPLRTVLRENPSSQTTLHCILRGTHFPFIHICTPARGGGCFGLRNRGVGLVYGVFMGPGAARPVFPQSVPRAWPPPPHVHAVGPQIATPSGPRASPGLSPMLLARLAPGHKSARLWTLSLGWYMVT